MVILDKKCEELIELPMWKLTQLEIEEKLRKIEDWEKLEDIQNFIDMLTRYKTIMSPARFRKKQLSD